MIVELVSLALPPDLDFYRTRKDIDLNFTISLAESA
jgi:hypothetical protein